MSNDMLSQEEIDALLRGEVNNNENINTENIDAEEDDELFSDLEKDALGEIGNISMGTAATTLSALLRKKVLITTPKVSISNSYKLSKLQKKPFLAVDVKYKYGLKGSNLLILKSDDAKIITDLMMGGEGVITDRELNDMDLSAISEAMNQMVGSSSTSLSEMFGSKIDIEPPTVELVDINDDNTDFHLFDKNINFVKISFNMVIGDVIDSEIMQILPIEFARDLVDKVLNKSQKYTVTQNIVEESNIEKKESINSNDYFDNDVENQNIKNINNIQSNQMDTNEPVNIKKVEFKSFENENNKKYSEGIEMLNEIPIEITVELGRATRKISEVLEYGPGTIIELDKLVGEPLDILANGRNIAKGEVVVIDDNFGIRITEIINLSKKIK